MDDLRIVLMVLGVLAVVALIVHGMWTVRKNNQDEIADAPRSAKLNMSSSETIEDNSSAAEDVKVKPANETIVKEKVVKEKSSLFSRKAKIEPEPTKQRVEPNFDEGQLEMELPAETRSIDDAALSSVDIEPEPQTVEDSTKVTNATNASAEPEATSEPDQVLILNVVVPEGQVISGAALLPFLLTLGFKFGEMAIFHRHEESSGDGDVLFSLANMFNPGTFDIDNMETFSSQGISLFMTLPVKGEATQVFNMMHNAAKKLAAEFNGQVLDGQRSVLTRQTVQHYVERIREYERRQLLKA
ncbi:cell division protein ZipA [Saccharobesus litoralis]|uniref:Cell division protein ZipA n=1 Tax=Saccharobesus litoralis TaxID=2172099 RepID=A0A2S0VTV4_9ALTE|nr:cell division protein ZipA [Saccharobesus litoralis]AWB67648.1 cell division protein ZipA [Saccharobesus litoralis]